MAPALILAREGWARFLPRREFGGRDEHAIACRAARRPGKPPHGFCAKGKPGLS